MTDKKKDDADDKTINEESTSKEPASTRDVNYEDPQPVVIACTPVWRYLLIMNQEVIGLANGVIISGASGTYAQHKELVEFIDSFLPQFREIVERTTGYKKH